MVERTNLQRLWGYSLILGVLVPCYEVRPQSITEMVNDGANWLLANRTGDHWTTSFSLATGTHGTVAVTAICAEALLLSPGYVTNPDQKSAVEDATKFILTTSVGPSCVGGFDPEPFAALFALRFLLRLESEGQLNQFPTIFADDITSRIEELKSMVNSCLGTGAGSLPGETCPNTPFGYPYMSGFFSKPASFLIAPAAITMADANALGHSVDMAALFRGLDTIACQRTDSGLHAGAYVYQSTRVLAGSCATPPEMTVGEFEFQCKLFTIPGSLSRMGASEHALSAWNHPNANMTRFKAAVAWFFRNDFTFNGDGVTEPDDPTDKSAYGWLLSQKGRNGHLGDYNIADWFLSYAFYFTSLAIEKLSKDPPPEGCSECPEWRATIVNRLRNLREVGQDTWNDWCPTPAEAGDPQCDSNPAHRTYSTAMAILTLLAPTYLSGIPLGDPNSPGSVSGSVSDSGSGSGLANWDVCLKSNSIRFHEHTTTTAPGAYTFTTVPPAEDYTVSPVRQPGWSQTSPQPTNRLGVRRGLWNGSEVPYADVWGSSWGGKDYAILGHENISAGVDLVDVTMPCQPTLVHNWQPIRPPPFGQGADCVEFEDVVVQGSTGFFASNGGCGVVVVDLSPLPGGPPVELKRINATTYQNQGVNHVHNVFVEGDYLFIADDLTNKIPVFNVSNPSNPSYVVTITSPTNEHVHDVYVRGNRLYASMLGSTSTGGVDIFDISDVKKWDHLGKVGPLVGTHSCWTIEDGRFLVVAQERGPLVFSEAFNVTIWDVSNPCSPPSQPVATISSPPVTPYPSFTLVAWSPHNPFVSKNLLYVSWYQAGAFVFDISNPTQPCQASNAPFFESPFLQNVCGTGTFPLGHFDTFGAPVETPFEAGRYTGNWGIYPFLGSDKILVSDTDHGLSVLSSSGESHNLSVGLTAIQNINFGFVNPGLDCDSNGVPDSEEVGGNATLLSANFSTGSFPAGWTATGAWHVTSNCPRAGACAPTKWAYYGQDNGCNFNLGNTSGVLTAPPVKIPVNPLSVTLTYCSAYGGEAGNSNSSGFDWAWVMVNGVEVDDVSQAGDQSTWATRTVDLTAFAGQTITLSWKFDSKDGIANTELGWEIANIVLTVQFPDRDCDNDSSVDVCETGYRITDLGTLGGTTSYAWAVNEWGEVAGYAYLSGNSSRAFFWRDDNRNGSSDPGEMRNLGTLGGSVSYGYGINDFGNVVGYSIAPSGYAHAFLWKDTNCNRQSDPGEMMDLGTLGGNSSVGYGVNNAGKVVGYAYTAGGTYHAFLWNGTMTDLGTFGGTISVANAINELDQVTGYAMTAGNATSRAFRWQNGVLMNLGSLGGATCNALGINDTGHVVGVSEIVTTTDDHAFLWNGVSMSNLGDLGGPNSVAFGINGSGEIVGWASTATSGAHAFRRTTGALQDLNGFVLPCAGWVLTTARGLNDAGQIVGAGTIGGKTRAYLLTPVP